MVIAGWKDLCIDAVDAGRIAEFWGASLGMEVELPSGGDAVLRGLRPTETIWLNAVPEPGTVKQRVHLDVAAASVDPFLALGASMQVASEESGFPWSVLRDPEGGEFCVFAPR